MIEALNQLHSAVGITLILVCGGIIVYFIYEIFEIIKSIGD